MTFIRLSTFSLFFVPLPPELYFGWNYDRNLVIAGALKDSRYLKRIISLTSWRTRRQWVGVKTTVAPATAIYWRRRRVRRYVINKERPHTDGRRTDRQRCFLGYSNHSNSNHSVSLSFFLLYTHTEFTRRHGFLRACRDRIHWLRQRPYPSFVYGVI